MEDQTTILERVAQPESLSNDILEVMSGPDDGRIYEISKDRITIGRSGDRDFALTLEPSVSRIHAEILVRDAKYYIRDCQSKNGTSVDGKMIKPDEEVPLQPNQIFQIADVKLRLRLKSNKEQRF